MDHFAEHFLGPVEDEEYLEETEDDGLGYYEDGVKRTLTDEQIAIFRHSEIQTLLRERQNAEEAKEEEYTSPAIKLAETMMDDGMAEDKYWNRAVIESAAEEVELEDGELDDDISTPQDTSSQPPQNQGNKKNKRKQNKNAKKGQRLPQPRGFFKQNVKPDLRKRTWDKVGSGLGNLDYDEESSVASAPAHAAQRRRISYDDD